MRDRCRNWLLRHWPYALLGDRAMLWFLVLLGYTYLTGCDPITPIADFSTGGLYSVGRGLASGNFGQAIGSDLGTAGILESAGKQTAGPLPTQIARAVIGGGAGAAGALGGGAAPTFAGGVEGTSTGASGVAPGFLDNVGSGVQAIPPAPLNPAFGQPPLPGEELGFGGGGTGAGGTSLLERAAPLSGAGTVGGFDIRGTPPGGSAPAGDLSLPSLPGDAGGSAAPAGGVGSKGDMMKALLALQALQTAKGLVPGQPQTPQDPQAALAANEAQQQADQTRAIQALIPERAAGAAARGLSGASPEFLAGEVGNDPQTLALVMQYLNSRGGSA